MRKIIFILVLFVSFKLSAHVVDRYYGEEYHYYYCGEPTPIQQMGNKINGAKYAVCAYSPDTCTYYVIYFSEKSTAFNFCQHYKYLTKDLMEQGEYVWFLDKVSAKVSNFMRGYYEHSNYYPDWDTFCNGRLLRFLATLY